MIVGGWFRSDSKWLVWKWLLLAGLEVIVGDWFGSGCWWIVWK